MNGQPGIGPTERGEHPTPSPTDQQRIEQLEREVATLREQVARLDRIVSQMSHGLQVTRSMMSS